MRFIDQTRVEFNKELWPDSLWRRRLFIIIFGTNTHAGRRFDIAVLWAIVLSIFVVMLESVRHIKEEYGDLLRIAEWVFTIIFTLEYILRMISIKKPWYYISSFYGIIDLISVIPTYISIFVVGGQYLLIIRALRLLRIFRVLKLTRYMGEASSLGKALNASRHKITVFMWVVFTIVIIMGTLMYLIEGGSNGFTSIPRSIYWAIVTLTTVGYGDIAPQTVLGQILASLIMILGYAIIAVPTGIVTSEITQQKINSRIIQDCKKCGFNDHAPDAVFCKRCGTILEIVQEIKNESDQEELK
jgi:voltage-gated potassium channel